MLRDLLKGLSSLKNLTLELGHPLIDDRWMATVIEGLKDHAGMLAFSLKVYGE